MRWVLLASAAAICATSFQTVWAAAPVDEAVPLSGQVMPDGTVRRVMPAGPTQTAAPNAAGSAAVPSNPPAMPATTGIEMPATQPTATPGGPTAMPPSPTPGADASGPVMTLEQALAAAYTSNPALLAARAQQRALDETLPRATAGWKPTVTLQGSYGSNATDTENPTATSAGEGAQFKTHPLSGQVTVSQPVFTGGRTFFGLRQAQHNVEAGRARLVSQEQQTLLDVVTAYFDVIQNRATVELNQNNISVLQKQLDAAQDRFRVGEITRTDVAQSEARLKLGETQLIQAQAQLVASIDAYRTAVGTTPASLDRSPPLPSLPASEENALATAQVNSPAVVAARETEKASNAAVYVAFGGLLPTVTIDGTIAHSEGRQNSPFFGTSDIITDQRAVTGNVRVPIYQAGTEFASIRQAKHTASQNRLLTAQAGRDVEENVANAWEAMRAATAAIRSNQQQVNANQIAYNGVVQEAEVGSRTTLDVLNAEQELLNSQVALVRSQRDQYVAAYGLLASMGMLTARSLGLPVDIYDPKAHSHSLIWKQFWPGAGE